MRSAGKHKRLESGLFVDVLVMWVMGLDRFSAGKEILVDDAGWGDFILGVVIGALKLPDRRYLDVGFQSPLSSRPTSKINSIWMTP